MGQLMQLLHIAVHPKGKPIVHLDMPFSEGTWTLQAKVKVFATTCSEGMWIHRDLNGQPLEFCLWHPLRP